MFLKGSKRKEQPDDELIRSYKQSGDRQLVAELYQRYLELVFGLCLKYLPDEESAKDAVMEIYGVLTEKLLNQDVERFRSWLFVLSKNHCLQIIRKTKMIMTEIPDNDMHSAGFLHHDEEYEVVESYEELKDCLKRLPDGQQKCVSMFYFDKKSYEEIAEILNTGRDQVRSHIQNGRRNLKICLMKKSNGSF